jgi:hypothetical protein
VAYHRRGGEISSSKGGEYGFWTDIDHCCEIKSSLLIESAKYDIDH